MAKRDFRKFKVGDILCPLPSRTRCYDYGLKHLEKVKVTHVQHTNYGGVNSSQQLTLKVIKGHASNYMGRHSKGSSIYGYNDGYVLNILQGKGSYEIF